MVMRGKVEITIAVKLHLRRTAGRIKGELDLASGDTTGSAIGDQNSVLCRRAIGKLDETRRRTTYIAAIDCDRSISRRGHADQTKVIGEQKEAPGCPANCSAINRK